MTDDTRTLTELLKAIDVEPRDYESKDFEVDGKTVVKYTTDFERLLDRGTNEELITFAKDAEFVKAGDTVQLTIPMPCIKALDLDKALSSRRWHQADLTDEIKELFGVIRTKGNLFALNLELEKLKVKTYNKAKACKQGLSKSGNTGLILLEKDKETYLRKVREFAEFCEITFGADTVKKAIVEDF